MYITNTCISVVYCIILFLPLPLSQDPNTRRRIRKNRIRRYFYGKHKFPSLIGKLGAATTTGGVINLTINVHTLPSSYSPSRQTLKLSQLRFYRAGGLQLSEGMRLIGESTTSQDNTLLLKITPSNELSNSIVAILHPTDDDVDVTQSSSLQHQHKITGSGTGTSATGATGSGSTMHISNVAGFLCIVQVDLDNDTLVVLSPCPGTLPSRHLLVAGLKWVE